MATVMRFAQAFRTPDLRKKLIFTFGIIVVFRFGSALPAPGISAPNVRYCSGLETSRGAAANVYAVLNVFSGNSLLHVTVFALGIMPYITASIIVQLMTQVVPRGATEVAVGPYRAWLAPPGYVPSGDGPSLAGTALVIEGDGRDLVIGASGLPRSALVSLVSAGLSAA